MKQEILDRYKDVEFRFEIYREFRFTFVGKYDDNPVVINYGECSEEIAHLKVEPNRSYGIAYLLEDSGFSIEEFCSDTHKKVFEYKN